MPDDKANQNNRGPPGNTASRGGKNIIPKTRARHFLEFIASRRGKNIIAKTRTTHFLELIFKGATWQKMSIERSQLQVELLQKGRELIEDLGTRTRSKVLTSNEDLLDTNAFFKRYRSKFNDLSDQKVLTAINRGATDKSPFWLDNLVVPEHITIEHKAIICNLLEAEYKQRCPHSTSELKSAIVNNGLQLLGTVSVGLGLFEQTAEATSVLNISAGFIKPLAESLGASSALAGTAVISPFSMVGAAFYLFLVCKSAVKYRHELLTIKQEEDLLQTSIQKIKGMFSDKQISINDLDNHLKNEDYTKLKECIKELIKKGDTKNENLEEINKQLDEIDDLQSSISKRQIMLAYRQADLATNTTIFCTILAVSLLSALFMTGAAMTGPVSLPLLSIVAIGAVGVYMTSKNFERIKRKHDAVITEQVCNQTFTPDKFSKEELESVVAMTKEFDELSKKGSLLRYLFPDRYVADINSIRKAVNDFIIAKPEDEDEMKSKIIKCIGAKNKHGRQSFERTSDFDQLKELLDQNPKDNYKILTTTLLEIVNDTTLLNRGYSAKCPGLYMTQQIFIKKQKDAVHKLTQEESNSIVKMTEISDRQKVTNANGPQNISTLKSIHKQSSRSVETNTGTKLKDAKKNSKEIVDITRKHHDENINRSKQASGRGTNNYKPGGRSLTL